MNREKSLVKNTFILSIGTFLPKLASFVTLPILTGFLTKEEYGTYDLITVLVSLLLPAITLQIQTAAFRFLIDCREDEKKKKDIISNIYLFISAVSLVALVVTFFVLSDYDPWLRILICLYFFSDILANTARQVVRGLSANMSYSISAIIASIGKLIFAVVFVWYFKIGLVGATLALVASEVLSFAFLFFKQKLYRYIRFDHINKKVLKELIGYSWPMVPNSMSMWVMQLSDRLVVTSFMGIATNAVYAVANKLPSMLTLAQNTFTMAWQENASIVSKDEDTDAYYSSMFRTIYDLMAGFMGVLIALTPLLFRVLVQGDYWDAYNHIAILYMAIFFRSLCSFFGGIYVAYKKTKSVGITSMLAAACNLAVDLSLIHFIGLYAASGSTLVSYLLLFLFRLRGVKKLVDIHYEYKHMVIVMAFMIAECALSMAQWWPLDLVNLALSFTVFFVLNRPFVKKIGKVLKRKLFKKRKKQS